MSAVVRMSAAMVAAGVAIAGTTAPPATAAVLPPPAIVSHAVELSAVSVPSGGLITSFLGNQVLYCSLICTSAIQGVVAVSGVALATPATFVTGLQQSGNLLKAIGLSAASVTGAAQTAAADVIFKDGMEVAPRALNAFEVGVVGLMNIVPAAAHGLPSLLAAIQTARSDTYTALNRPIVPNPEPTVMPRGVLQVAVIGAINVVAAVIFPAFNDVLLGAFQVPNAVAQTLASTGDPVKAVAAGLSTAATVAGNAGRVITDAVVTAIDDVRAASRPTPSGLSQNRLAAVAEATPEVHTEASDPAEHIDAAGSKKAATDEKTSASKTSTKKASASEDTTAEPEKLSATTQPDSDPVEPHQASADEPTEHHATDTDGGAADEHPHTVTRSESEPDA